jgi:hypothetical protein
MAQKAKYLIRKGGIMPDNPYISVTTQIRSLLIALDLVPPGCATSEAFVNDGPNWHVNLRNHPWRLEYVERVEAEACWFELKLFAHDLRVFSLRSPIADQNGEDTRDKSHWMLDVVSFSDVAKNEVLHRALERVNDELLGCIMEYSLHSYSQRKEDAFLEIPESERKSSISPYVIGFIARMLNWFAQQPRLNPSPL